MEGVDELYKDEEIYKDEDDEYTNSVYEDEDYMKIDSTRNSTGDLDI
jgi:hypothetical protein